MKTEIISQASAMLDASIMDYQPLVAVFNGVVEAAVPNEESLQRAIQAHSIYREVIQYPVGYVQMLEAALATMRDMKRSDIRLDIKVIPASATVTVVIKNN